MSDLLAQTGVDAREAARRILAGRKFHPVKVPRPLHGLLAQLGAWLEQIFAPVVRLWDRWITGAVGWAILVITVVFVTVLVFRLVRRRTSMALQTREGHHRPAGSPDDPDALEAEAADAEAEGRLDVAVRLRFRAGLLRLAATGTLAYRPSLTNGELTRRVPSADLADLAIAFEEIAYGGRTAGAADVESARSQWPCVVAQARSG